MNAESATDYLLLTNIEFRSTSTKQRQRQIVP
jgi:hypothetical protein